MENIWSENKYINISLNVCLFLLSISFLHYAEVVVPIMCLLLFIDHKYQFKVLNIKTFIILCLFGISFAIFGSVLGLYRFIGLFLPMVYYVGSNIENLNENKIKKIIYIIVLGMTLHIVLNFACDLIVRGTNCFFRNSHLDFWIWDEYPTTQTGVFYIFLIGVIYYIFVYEKNKKIKNVSIILFIICFIYTLALGRRTPIFLLVVVVLCSFFIDYFVNKNKNKMANVLLLLLALFLIIGIFIYCIYTFNLFGLRMKFQSLGIVRKFTSLGFYSNRHNLTLATIKLAPTHLFGGMAITEITEYGPHELWLNTFDAAGIVPYVFIVIYSILALINLIKYVRNQKHSNENRLLVFGLFLAIGIQFFLEPIMTGSPIPLLCAVLLVTIIEKYQME